MKPIDQTRTGKNGNCFQAVIASILELPLKKVPDFYNEVEDPQKAADNFADWLLAKHGMVPVIIRRGSETFDYYAQNCICEAMLPSLDHPGLEHSVVVKGGRIVHDPHPSKRSLKLFDKVKEITLFVAVRPHKMTRNR